VVTHGAVQQTADKAGSSQGDNVTAGPANTRASLAAASRIRLQEVDDE